MQIVDLVLMFAVSMLSRLAADFVTNRFLKIIGCLKELIGEPILTCQ